MTKPIQPKEIIFYMDEKGKEPFIDWFNNLKNPETRRRILLRMRRLEQGNYGDYKSLEKDFFELRFTYGSGYRIYFGEDGKKWVVLLIGGDKSSQKKDIKKAKAYWKEYKDHVST